MHRALSEFSQFDVHGGRVGMGALGAYLAIVLFLTVGQALACAFGARALMVNKGRSAAGGFCLGLFLGLIGVLIAAVMPTTPEYEAAKMRRQMELMGLAPGGAPFAPSGFAQPAAVAPRRDVPRPLVPMAIMVAATGVAYAVVAKWDRNAVVGYEASSGTVWLAMLLSLGVCAAAIWAMRQQNEIYVSLVVGLMMGLGSAGVANLVWSINLTSPSRVVVMVADVVVLVAAGLVVFDRGRPVEVPTWWMWAWAGTAAVIVLSVALSFRVVLSIGAIAGVIAVFGAVRHSQRSLSVAVGGCRLGRRIVRADSAVGWPWLRVGRHQWAGLARACRSGARGRGLRGVASGTGWARGTGGSGTVSRRAVRAAESAAGDTADLPAAAGTAASPAAAAGWWLGICVRPLGQAAFT